MGREGLGKQIGGGRCRRVEAFWDWNRERGEGGGGGEGRIFLVGMVDGGGSKDGWGVVGRLGRGLDSRTVTKYLARNDTVVGW